MRLKTILPILVPEATLVPQTIKTGQQNEYQRILSIVQGVCINLLLQKDITAVKLIKIYWEEHLLSLEISSLSSKFNLNIYLFQFVSCFNNKTSDLFEVNISRTETEEEIKNLVRSSILSKIFLLNKGKYKEEIVKQALENLRLEKEILSFRKSTTIDDISGVDFWICVRNSLNKTEDMPLQVKSSKQQQKEHLCRYYKIPSITILNGMSIEDVKKIIRKIVDAYTSYKKEYLHL